MDNSLIRFLNNFSDAKNLQNSKMTDFDYDMQIHLKPSEHYTGITNCPTGIGFDALYKAYLVDADNNVLVDVTNKCFIQEFIDDVTGLQQMKWEIINLAVDFYTDLVYLRLDHDIVGGESFWSNPFLVSYYDLDETLRFKFKHNRNLDGTNYRVANVSQSIRLKCRKQKTDFTSTSSSYTTFDGDKLSSRLIKTKFYDLIMDMTNDFIYDRLQYILSHDVIYVENHGQMVRITDKQTFSSADKYSETTNISQNKFKVAIDESDIDQDDYQIFVKPTLFSTSRIPVGLYSTIDYDATTTNSTLFKVIFNLPITILPIIAIKIFKANLQIGTLDSTKCTVINNNELHLDVTGIVDSGDFDNYCITINANSIRTQNVIVPFGYLFFAGWSFNQWSFEIASGDYDDRDYDDSDYFSV